jgi:phospholipid/cholesterol/gamma-HCH transport system substrate-binding protein
VKSFRDRNPYAVGIVSVLVIGALTGFAFAVGLLGLLKDTYEVRAVFADAAGLRTGNEIRLAGVKVGAVSEVEVDRAHGQVIVTLQINSGVDVREQATAEIALNTLLGAKVVRIDDAEKGARLFADMDDEDREIPFERAGTRVPFDVFELTRIATEGVQELDTDLVNDLVNDLADVTEGRRDDFTALITSIDEVSRAIASRDTELSQLLQRADTITATLAERDDTLVALIDQSRAILRLLEERRQELATAIGEGAEAVTALAEIIADNRVTLDNLLTNLHPTLAAVEAELDDVNRALAWGGPGFMGQALAGSHGPWLNIYVRTLGPASATLICDLLGIVNCIP